MVIFNSYVQLPEGKTGMDRVLVGWFLSNHVFWVGAWRVKSSEWYSVGRCTAKAEMLMLHHWSKVKYHSITGFLWIWSIHLLESDGDMKVATLSPKSSPVALKQTEAVYFGGGTILAGNTGSPCVGLHPAWCFWGTLESEVREVPVLRLRMPGRIVDDVSLDTYSYIIHVMGKQYVHII